MHPSAMSMEKVRGLGIGHDGQSSTSMYVGTVATSVAQIGE